MLRAHGNTLGVRGNMVYACGFRLGVRGYMVCACGFWKKFRPQKLQTTCKRSGTHSYGMRWDDLRELAFYRAMHSYGMQQRTYGMRQRTNGMQQRTNINSLRENIIVEDVSFYQHFFPTGNKQLALYHCLLPTADSQLATHN